MCCVINDVFVVWWCLFGLVWFGLFVILVVCVVVAVRCLFVGLFLPTQFVIETITAVVNYCASALKLGLLLVGPAMFDGV
jgi:hypothetical protein